MQEVTISLPPVIIAAVINMGLGAFWYSMSGFGKSWMKLSGLSKEDLDQAKKKGMAMSYALATIGSLVLAYVFAHVLAYSEATTVAEGLQGAFWMWLGFVAVVLMGSILWEGKSWKLFAINSGYYLVSLLIMSVVLVSLK